MKLSTVPRAYRNLRRFREIATVLRRYGLADWLSRYSLPFRDWAKDDDGVALSQFSSGQRLRMALTELGPTFIKLGQLLASRPDIVGREIAEELKSLRADVRGESFESIDSTLRSELGMDYRDEIIDIESRPLACASIGQVHRGVLADGTRVVLKIQRSDIRRTVHEDIEILTGLAPLVSRVDAVSAWSPVEMIESLAPIIRRELDFESERRNLCSLGGTLRGTPGIIVPRTIDALCGPRVLVMEQIDGEPLQNWIANHRDAPECQSIGRRLAGAYLHMVFDRASFHADPHLGNLLVTPNGDLAILDFGMVGQIDETLRETMLSMLSALAAGDTRRIARLVRRFGRPPADLDEGKLRTDVGAFVSDYCHQSLGSFRTTDALNDLSRILHAHRIRLPHQSALLLKMLITLEGTLGEMGVTFNSLDIVSRLVRRQMVRRLSPRRRLTQMSRLYDEAEYFLETAPEEALSLLNQVRRGEASVQLQHRRLGPTVNRLVLGLMSSAVFLGSAILMATEVPPRLFAGSPDSPLHNVSLLGLIGLVGSFTVMCWLIVAINRSGNLTRD